MSRKHFIFVAGAVVSLLIQTAARGADKAAGVAITEHGDKVRVEIDGQLFTEYVFKGAPHVYFYPLLGPGGLQMTRHWPMKEVPGEEQDHKHHRSLWYSHGAVNGVDFWAETDKAGKILHEKFLEIKSGADAGVIRSQNKWVGPDGKTVLRDERTFRVFARPGGERVFDFEVTLKAPSDKEVILGDTKEGSMAIRVAESMRLALPKEKGAKKAAVLLGASASGAATESRITVPGATGSTPSEGSSRTGRVASRASNNTSGCCAEKAFSARSR